MVATWLDGDDEHNGDEHKEDNDAKEDGDEHGGDGDVVATCSKAFLPTESNTTGVKQGSKVFPPSWSVKTLQTTRFCHPDQNKLEG